MSDLSGGTKAPPGCPWYRATWVFPTTVVVVAGVIAIALLVAVWWPSNIDDISGKLTLTVGIFGGLLFVLNFVINHRRTVALEEQLEIQRNQLEYQRESDKNRQHQELYVSSIRNLGDPSSVYGLERLAKESEIWAPRIATIFCKYIRSKTTEVDYQKEEKHRDEPSFEVLTMVEVLTVPGNPFDSAQFDLSGANLGGINLSGVDLKGTNLTKANLRGADLRKTNLNGTNLSKTNLSGANLSGNDLRRVDFKNDTDLSRANLRGVDLSGAVLSGTDTNNPGNIEAYIGGVRVSRVNLSQADLGGANLSETDMIQVNLSGANLSGANLKGANLSGANLSQTDLCDTNLTETNITEADLRRSIRLTEDRRKWGSFSECKMDLGYPAAKLQDIYWGIYTRDLAEIELRDLGTGSRENQNQHLTENVIRREPTQEEKEYLVGKDNVNRCEWGDILVLEGDSVHERLI